MLVSLFLCIGIRLRNHCNQIMTDPIKYWTIKQIFHNQKNNKDDSLSIDRLKPASIEKPSDWLTENETVVHKNKDKNASSTNQNYIIEWEKLNLVDIFISLPSSETMYHNVLIEICIDKRNIEM